MLMAEGKMGDKFEFLNEKLTIIEILSKILLQTNGFGHKNGTYCKYITMVVYIICLFLSFKYTSSIASNCTGLFTIHTTRNANKQKNHK